MNRSDLRYGTVGLCMVLTACAPFAGVPPVPLAGNASRDVGIAYSGTFSEKSWFPEQANSHQDFMGVDLWRRVQRSDRLTLLARASYGKAGDNDHGALGVGAQIKLNDGDSALVGLDLGIGLAWVQLGLPLSVALSDRIWLYTQPTIQVSDRASNHLPVGLSVQARDRLRLHVEVGRHALQLPFGLLSLNEDQSYYAGLGVSFVGDSRR